jgi:hypothetical protein
MFILLPNNSPSSYSVDDCPAAVDECPFKEADPNERVSEAFDCLRATAQHRRLDIPLVPKILPTRPLIRTSF